MRYSILELADSYKYSHSTQYAQDAVSMYDYAIPRSAKAYPEMVFCGLQYYISEYLNKPFTKEYIQHTAELTRVHGIPFAQKDCGTPIRHTKGL